VLQASPTESIFPEVLLEEQITHFMTYYRIIDLLLNYFILMKEFKILCHIVCYFRTVSGFGFVTEIFRIKYRHDDHSNLTLFMQGVSGGKVNILGGGSMEYSE
jgi:hypothetical protein